MATGFIWDERYVWHDAGFDLPPGPYYQPFPSYDSPESKRRIRNLLEVSGLLDKLIPIHPRVATEKELLRFHMRDYVERVKSLSQSTGGNVGPGAHVGLGTYDIARLAVGGCIVAVDAVLDGTVDNAYALVRPCGHHATANSGAGFSIFSNIALAVMHARAERDVARIAIVDWDVHHGNGTQAAFYRDPTVLTISLHQNNHYPKNSGTLEERGDGPGRGFDLNLPLPPGSGHGAYLAAFERVVLPAVQGFEPQLIVVASGFDASGDDPLGRMQCYSETYREMTLMLKSVAQELCEGRLVACHEGGYSPRYVPFCALATIEALAGSERRLMIHEAGIFQVTAGKVCSLIKKKS